MRTARGFASLDNYFSLFRAWRMGLIMSPRRIAYVGAQCGDLALVAAGRLAVGGSRGLARGLANLPRVARVACGQGMVQVVKCLCSHARIAACVLSGIAVLCVSTAARAQQHIDIAMEAGVAQRWLTSRPTEGGRPGANATLGPIVRATSHLAILPLFRAGLSGQLAYSPVESGDRILFGGGVDLRGTLPLQIKNLRPFIGFGFDYRRIAQTGRVNAPSVSGGFLVVPITVGAMYKFRKPYEIGGVMGLDLAFGWHGAAYREPSGQGNDAVALWLAVAFGFDG
jgi:hypothetical protein